MSTAAAAACALLHCTLVTTGLYGEKESIAHPNATHARWRAIKTVVTQTRLLLPLLQVLLLLLLICGSTQLPVCDVHH
jgi:hypothetical protein